MRRFWVMAFLVGCGGDNQLMSPELPDLAMQGVAPGAVGAACSDDNQCSFGVCLAIGRCSHTCPLPSCELGWICAPEGARSVCQCPTLAAETCNGVDDDCNGLVDDNAVCPGGGACVKGQCLCQTPAGANHLRLVADGIQLPMQRIDFAVDLNGDGKVDNQYGNIIGALSAQNLMPQTSVDAQVASGQVLLLIDVRSSDGTFTSDSCAGARVTNGKPMAAPDFSGNGSFTVDASVMAGDFKGAITTSRLLSESPVTTTTPVTLDVYLPLFSLSPNTPIGKVKLTAAQLKYDRVTRRGQVNGVIRKADLDSSNANAAVLLDQQVQANPTSSSSQQLLSIFDTGGAADPSCGQTCKNPDGSCAVSHDGHIAICEVTTNSIIKNVLAPDVDMFDASGNYAPNPANTDKDSLSVGFGFEAVGANF
jgi:hypothetical protein